MNKPCWFFKGSWSYRVDGIILAITPRLIGGSYAVVQITKSLYKDYNYEPGHTVEISVTELRFDKKTLDSQNF